MENNSGARKQSPLSIVAFILSLTYYLSPVGVILAIVDLSTKNRDKKHVFSIIALIVGGIISIVMLTSCFSSKAGESNKNPAIDTAVQDTETKKEDSDLAPTAKTAENKTEKPTKAPTEAPNKDPKDTIKEYVTRCIILNFDHTHIDEIRINEDLGSEKENDYIVLINLTWNQKNSGELSKQVLELYSNDLAARVGKDLSDVSGIAIFWKVPYLNNADAKMQYERKNGGMYLADEMWDKAFQ